MCDVVCRAQAENRRKIEKVRVRRRMGNGAQKGRKEQV
jgi:hypothetical protein